MKIWVDGELRFDGNLQKGCGNPIFEYGMTIPLIDDDKQTEAQTQNGRTDSGLDSISENEQQVNENTIL